MTRKALIAGNWKMHLTVKEACTLANEVIKALPAERDDREVLIAPPFTALQAVGKTLTSSRVLLSGQNVCWEEKGPFTGEIAPGMLKDCGATHAIIGHSERRQIFHESDEMINNRVTGALKHGIRPVLCIGETLEEREAERTFAVLEAQVKAGLTGVTHEEMEAVVIAYEPVWAIGTGKTASKEQAQNAHAFIREVIIKLYEKTVAEKLRILYGGSVKPTNIDALMSQPDIDGALVGGAALDGVSFARIINFTV